ncbi:TPA: SPOR domain-containing protein [Photobacterium damselae]
MIGHDATTRLDLDSQIQFLSRLQFVTQFSSHLIQISGPFGAGKTELLHCYLEHFSPEQHQVLLSAEPDMSLTSVRTQLLQQLVPTKPFNEQDSLLQSISHMLSSDRLHCLLVVDNAHYLSIPILAELWELVCHANQQADWQLNVLLFTEPDVIAQPLAKMTHGQSEMPLELEIAPLPANEVLQLIEHCYEQDLQKRRELKLRYQHSFAFPGQLDEDTQPPGEEVSMTASHQLSLRTGLLIGVLLALVVALLWLWPESKPSEDSAIDSSASQVMEGKELISSGEPTEDTAALPPDVTQAGLTVGRTDTDKRVVVPAQVVDAMMGDQALGLVGAQTHFSDAEINALEPANVHPSSVTSPQATTTPLSESEPISESVKPEQPAKSLDKSLKQHDTPQPISHNNQHSDKQILQQVNSRHYALQLAAVHSWQQAKQFVAKYGVTESAHIYQTERQGKAWFIVVIGDYSSATQAKRAKNQLSHEVQALKPWPKSYAQIQKEMNRVK